MDPAFCCIACQFSHESLLTVERLGNTVSYIDDTTENHTLHYSKSILDNAGCPPHTPALGQVKEGSRDRRR